MKSFTIPSREFPTYVSPLINLANRFSQATWPKHVGEVKKMVKELEPKSLEEWAKWYVTNHPDAIDDAALRVAAMLNNFRNALDNVDQQMVWRWVYDLIVNKTYTGTYAKQAIVENLSARFGERFSYPSKGEEAEGVDCKIDGLPISIRRERPDNQPVGHHVIYYKEKKSGEIVVSGIPD